MASGIWVSEAEKKYNETLGQRIWAARRAAGMAQADLAAKLGASKFALCRVEGGKIRCPVLWLDTLARELNISLRYLVPKSECAVGATRRK